MRKQKKWFSAILGLLLMLGTFSACSKAPNAARKTSMTQKESVKHRKKVSDAQANSKKKATIASRLKARPGQQLTYVAFGDSITVGLFADQKNQDFANLFARDLEQRTGRSIQMVEQAQVGKTVANFGLPTVDQVIATKPDLVTIEFGTNDAVGGANQTTLARFHEDLTTLVIQLQQQTSAELILMTTWSPQDGPYVASDLKFDQEIVTIGHNLQVPVVNLAQIWQHRGDVTGPPGQNIPNFTQWGERDTFHPNQAGHEAIAEVLEKRVCINQND